MAFFYKKHPPSSYIHVFGTSIAKTSYYDMQKTKVIFTGLTLLLCSGIYAQESSKLFVPINFQRAVQKGTRTSTGKPGDRYFQNRSDYSIKATFNPLTGSLEGKETIRYTNNSPDTLKQIVVRLYQNLFKPEATRQLDVDPTDLGEGVTILDLKIDNQSYAPSSLKHVGTNAFLSLQKGINPTNTTTIDISWKVKLPNKTQFRFGRYDATTYFVGYWFPQIAVYDDINGWSTDCFTGLQEFYNDYSNFEVELTLPKNQIVWATGELQNGKELFTDKIYERIERAQKTDSVTHIITAKDYNEGQILKAKGSSTWKFKATNVSDFAFGVSDHYVWDATSVTVDEKSQRRVMVNSVYKKDSKVSSDVASIARRCIQRYSTDILGVPYPYPQMTIYEGEGGMEYPMMCNDGPNENLLQRVFVTSHEVFHSYFPFMVGTNETLYAWIDEGITTVIPKAVELEYGNQNAHYYIKSYSKRMGTSNDIPLSVPSTNLCSTTYMMQNYGRAAAGFYTLNEMLGPDKFRMILQEFISRWESKHPTPTDLINTINDVTKNDYSWFWNKWFYEYGYADLYLDRVSLENNNVKLTICNKGNLPVPIKLKIYFNDNTFETIQESAMIWKTANSWDLNKSYSKPITKIVLGDNNTADADYSNNTYIVK